MFNSTFVSLQTQDIGFIQFCISCLKHIPRKSGMKVIYDQGKSASMKDFEGERWAEDLWFVCTCVRKSNDDWKVIVLLL